MKQKHAESIPPELLNEKIADASRAIFSYCMAKTPNRLEAEDLCQDILLELIRSSGSIRDSRAFYGFMWAVAGNVYKHWCRKKSRLQTCEFTEDIPAEESAIDKALADEENSDLYLLRRELSLLSEKYREAVILYYINRKSCSEIAQILSITESRVKYLLFKSRKILKEGMRMERKLGTLSYNPKTFVPMYHGSGPNRFWEFMQSKIRQNIVEACYNDSLTPEQISLETGIPLPYLDSEISALVDREILIKEGAHYKANIIILTAECTDEIIRSAASRHEEIAGLLAEFLETVAELVRKGYVLKGSDTYTVSMPLFTPAQYSAVCRLVKNFVTEKLEKTIHEINLTSAQIIGEHTPKHLQDQVPGIARTGRMVNMACIPLRILIDRKVLTSDWNPMEMPTMQIRLNREDIN